MRRLPTSVLAAAFVVACCQIASAADLTPLAYKAVPPAVTTGNWYFWLDGVYDSVRLPSSALGLHTSTAAGTPSALTDLGPSQSFDPTSTGGGARGALGYIVPGSDLRFELGGSYVAAKATGTQTTSVSPAATVVMLDGTTPSGYNCVVAACAATGNFSSNYTAWQLDGKVAAERRYGAITVTPSLTLFGGNTGDHQSFSQAFSQTNAGLFNTASYAAAVALHWTDLGARAGLDLSAPVGNALTLNLGGWIGAASRHASLSGSDTEVGIFGGIPAVPFGSAVSASSSRGVWLANGEAGLSYALNPAVTLRGFAGLNYDSAVPGLASPSYGGNFIAGTTPVPAGITYAQETSYYAGGGLLVRF